MYDDTENMIRTMVIEAIREKGARQVEVGRAIAEALAAYREAVNQRSDSVTFGNVKAGDDE